ncbi:MAG: polyprenyl synthetase family protein [Spirochaetes bacterium]|nr:polyprenyl synthetase family protein [Spirochaetota bacterium]
MERRGLDEELSRYGRRVARTLESFLERKAHELESVNGWGGDLTERLRQFCTAGKLIRGSLVLLTHDMLSFERTAGVTAPGCEAAAAAYELIHSFLLIHDDIMDRDRLRRGMPSIHYQYQKIVERITGTNGLHEGEGLGICAGDAALFLALELLSCETTAGCGPANTMKILLLWSRELSRVGVAQMQDVFFGTRHKEASEADIMSLYRFKTARYTFSVPFATGSILAGSDTPVTQALLNLGERFGVIYQLVDDRIDLFGEAKKTGKPIGTDLQGKKQTLLHYYLQRFATPEQKRRISEIFRKDRITEEDIAYIRREAVETGAVRRVEEMILKMKKESEKMLNALPVKEEYKRILGEILAHGVTRES